MANASEIVTLLVTLRDGEVRTALGAAGLTVMEVIRDQGIDELLAICGGCCSCGTCHVYVDPEQFVLLPAMSEDEDALLDASDHRTAYSRLACQLSSEKIPSGLRIQVAPED